MVLSSKLLKGMLAVVAKGTKVSHVFTGVHIGENVIEASNDQYLFRAVIESCEERLFTLVGTVPARAVSTNLDFDNKLATHFGTNEAIVGTNPIVDFDMNFPKCGAVVKDFNDSIASFPINFTVNILWLGLPAKFFKATEARFDFSENRNILKVTFKTDKVHETEMYTTLIKEN